MTEAGETWQSLVRAACPPLAQFREKLQSFSEATVNTVDVNGTILHQICRTCCFQDRSEKSDGEYVEILSLLLERMSPSAIDACDHEGNTALHIAVHGAGYYNWVAVGIVVKLLTHMSHEAVNALSRCSWILRAHTSSWLERSDREFEERLRTKNLIDPRGYTALDLALSIRGKICNPYIIGLLRLHTVGYNWLWYYKVSHLNTNEKLMFSRYANTANPKRWSPWKKPPFLAEEKVFKHILVFPPTQVSLPRFHQQEVETDVRIREFWKRVMLHYSCDAVGGPTLIRQLWFHCPVLRNRVVWVNVWSHILELDGDNPHNQRLLEELLRHVLTNAQNKNASSKRARKHGEIDSNTPENVIVNTETHRLLGSDRKRPKVVHLTIDASGLVYEDVGGRRVYVLD